MFIGFHFVGISPTQMPLKTHGNQQQGFMNKYIMLYIYCKEFLNIFLENKLFKNKLWTVTVRGRTKIKRKLAMVCLIMATFFNPLGFDAMFAMIMKWTGSYWTTDLIFYFLSACFFGLYFWLSPTSKRGLLNLKRKITNFIK